MTRRERLAFLGLVAFLVVVAWCSSLTGLQAAAVALWLAAVLLWLDRQYGRVG